MDPNSKIGVLANSVRDCYQAKNVFNRLNTATQKFMKYSLGDLGFIIEDPLVQAANQQRSPPRLALPGLPRDGELSPCGGHAHAMSRFLSTIARNRTSRT